MALITQAQAELILDGNDVAEFTGGDAAVIAELLEEASDWVQEFATAAGVTLTAGSLTAAMRRRVAIRFIHAAAARTKKHRDAEGRNPFHVEHAQVEVELQAWAERTRQLSSDTPSTAPEVLSDEPRGWDPHSASAAGTTTGVV